MTANIPTPTSAQSTDALTAALLQDLLAEAPQLAHAADALLSPVADHRDELRQALLADGRIIPIADPTDTPHSLCAVDGGSVREHLYAADLLVAVATSAAGLTSTIHRPLTQRHWTTIRQYASDNDRLLSAAMASLELDIITSLDHDIRILDGAFRTPLLALIAAISGTSPTTQAAAAELITDDVLTAATTLSDPTRWHGTIVALPKADSSHRFSDHYEHLYGRSLPGGDRFLAAQVLEAGEMLYPRPASEYRTLHAAMDPTSNNPARVQQVTEALETAVTPLRVAAQTNRMLVTYIKPENADTVLKAEYHATEPLPDTIAPDSVAITTGCNLGRVLSDETPGPFMQEPFAQYAVDLNAKSVAVGAQALNEAMLAHLPDGGGRYLTLLARSYRTATARPAAR